jgi:hypothetical protein
MIMQILGLHIISIEKTDWQFSGSKIFFPVTVKLISEFYIHGFNHPVLIITIK